MPLIQNLQDTIGDILQQRLPEIEATSSSRGNVKPDYGITRESRQKIAVDVIRECPWHPYLMVAEIQPEITRRMNSAEKKELDFMMKGLFRLAWLYQNEAGNLAFRRLLGTNKKYWHNWRSVASRQRRSDPRGLLLENSEEDILEGDHSRYPTSWESAFYFKVMSAPELREYLQENNGEGRFNQPLGQIQEGRYYTLINGRNFSLADYFGGDDISSMDLAREVIENATGLFGQFLFDSKYKFYRISVNQWPATFALTIHPTVVRMNSEYAREMVELCFQKQGNRAVKKRLTKPEEQFVQSVLVNHYQYSENLIKVGKYGISDAYAFNTFDFIKGEQGDREIRRCLLIDNIRGAIRRATHFLLGDNESERRAKGLFSANKIDLFFEDYRSTLLYEKNEHHDCNVYYANQAGRGSPLDKQRTKIRGLGKKQSELIIELNGSEERIAQSILDSPTFGELICHAIDLINLGFFRIGGMKSRGLGMIHIKVKNFPSQKM